MKKLILFILIVNALACGTTDDGNPILPDIPVNQTVFLNTQNELQAIGGSALISGGIAGIIVYRFSNEQFLAWDRACPHLQPQTCSRMNINGLLMECPCDQTTFSILDGSPQNNTPYPARQYRVIKEGETLFITNF